MKAYKAFDKDLKCRDFQYEVGVEYEEEEAKLCSRGFHACENPLDTFRYYNLTDGSRFCEVDLDATEESETGDTKRCGKKIKILAEIGLSGMINAAVKFVFEKCKDADTAAASGESGNAAASGESGNAAASGWSGNAAASGVSGNAAASGVRGNAAASGVRGTAVCTGPDSSAVANGEQTIAVAWGWNSKAKGIKGSWLVLSERNTDGVIIDAKLVKVDGERIKADTWYVLANGEPKEEVNE